MIRLRDIMTSDVVTVTPELSLRGAMELFASRHISGAPVVAGGEVIGVVTATDLMGLASSLPGAPTARTDQMEWGELTSADDDAELATERESEPAATYFTDMWADAGADSAVRFEDVNGPEWNLLDEHTVSEAMTVRPIWKLSSETLVTIAADVMRAHRIHRVLVMDGPRLVGIATTMDIAAAVAEGKLTTRTHVFGSAPRVDRRR
jgi:CBS domain-containing protein